jgi:putative hydrolase of the HAD superfamily
MAFVGDKKKNMECAKRAGVKAILINRTDERKEYGQDFEIKNLSELVTIVR